MYAQNDAFPPLLFPYEDDDMWSISAVSRGVWRREIPLIYIIPHSTASRKREKNFLIFFRERKKRKRFLMYADIEIARWRKALGGVLISSIAVATSTFLPRSKFCLFLFSSAPLLCKKISLIKKKEEFRSCFARQRGEGGWVKPIHIHYCNLNLNLSLWKRHKTRKETENKISRFGNEMSWKH